MIITNLLGWGIILLASLSMKLFHLDQWRGCCIHKPPWGNQGLNVSFRKTELSTLCSPWFVLSTAVFLACAASSSEKGPQAFLNFYISYLQDGCIYFSANQLYDIISCFSVAIYEYERCLTWENCILECFYYQPNTFFPSLTQSFQIKTDYFHFILIIMNFHRWIAIF